MITIAHPEHSSGELKQRHFNIPYQHEIQSYKDCNITTSVFMLKLNKKTLNFKIFIYLNFLPILTCLYTTTVWKTQAFCMLHTEKK